MSTTPCTRWAFPPFASGCDVPAPRQESVARPVAAVSAQAATDPQNPLLALLISDLCKGHFNVAIRHFLMLRGCGVQLPALIERSCEKLLALCPADRLARIAADVDTWLRLTRVARRAQFANSPADASART